MEEEAGGGGEREPATVIIGRRITLLDQMSTAQDRRDQLAGLTLDAILFNKRPSPPPPASTSRTLLDIIRNEDPNGKSLGHKDKKSWNFFRDRLRLKRDGAAWTPSVRVPASDIPIQISSVNNSHGRSQLCRRTSVRFQTDPASDMRNQTEPPQYMSRPSSTDSPAHDEDSPPDESSSRSSRPQLARYESTRVPLWNSESDDYNNADPFEVAREGTRCLAVALAQERQLSAREAVVAQESAEAEAVAAALVEAETSAIAAEASLQGMSSDAEAQPEPAQQHDEPPVRMSLMDLLEETDRHMGVEGSRYTEGGNDDEEEEEDEAEAEEEGGSDVAAEAGGIEHNCCVCMVRHKGAAFIPCGHTFCRLCSRELWVQRGSCPLCNGFILEILDIF